MGRRGWSGCPEVKGSLVVKYVPRPKLVEWDEDEPHPVGQTIIEDDQEWSGLFDSEGTPLFRVKDPIGFRTS